MPPLPEGVRYIDAAAGWPAGKTVSDNWIVECNFPKGPRTQMAGF